MKNILRYFILFFILGLILTLYIVCDPFLRHNGHEATDTRMDSDCNKPLNKNKNDNSEHNTRENDETKDDQGTIALYAGIGIWDENLTAISNFLHSYGIDFVYLYENDLTVDSLNDLYDIIWFPGGYAAEYRYELRSHDNLRTFVAEGGTYIGICAGAYYAADIFSWKDEEYDYPFNLFAGVAAGPLRGATGWGHPVDLSLEEAFSFNHEDENNFTVYYYDGPYFNAHDHEKITVVARYKFNDEPAIVFGLYGNGKYLLIGPHPELGAYNSDSDQVNTDGLDGAQWPWLFELLNWLLTFE